MSTVITNSHNPIYFYIIDNNTLQVMWYY